MKALRQTGTDVPNLKLADVAELNPRLTEKLSADAEVAFVPMAALSAETASVTSEETRAYANVCKGYTSFASGDVLLAKITPCFENGKIAQANLTKRIGFGSTEFHVIRPSPDKLDARYTHHFLRLDRIRVAGERRMTGSGGQRRVPEAYLAELSIPLPPLAEQRRIAEVLDRAEALRAKRRAALAQLDALTQSLFLDLFGDPRTNERNWEKCRIESVVWDMRGGAALEPDDFVESGFPILHKGAIKALGEISIDPKKKTFATETYAAACRKNIVDREFMAVTLRDLVPSGPSIGFTADLRSGPFDQYLLAQGAYGFRIDETRVTREYLVYLSNNENFRHVFRQNSVGSTQIHIRTPIYLAIQIPLPPIALQREFARRMSAVEALKKAQRASLAELNALFASLQHRAFRGEL